MLRKLFRRVTDEAILLLMPALVLLGLFVLAIWDTTPQKPIPSAPEPVPYSDLSIATFFSLRDANDRIDQDHRPTDIRSYIDQVKGKRVMWWLAVTEVKERADHHEGFVAICDPDFAVTVDKLSQTGTTAGLVDPDSLYSSKRVYCFFDDKVGLDALKRELEQSREAAVHTFLRRRSQAELIVTEVDPKMRERFIATARSKARTKLMLADGIIMALREDGVELRHCKLSLLNGQ